MPIKIKDPSKCKEWERRRRDRLNDAFTNLAQLLPHYDPANIPAKIEILEKSTEFVKELRLSNSRLLSKQAETDEKCKLIKELQDEVNKLILRVKQLTILLKKADITIPTGPEIKSLGSRRLKWSGKLKPDDVENSVISNKNSTSGEKIELSVEKAHEPIVSSITTNTTSDSISGVRTNSTATSTSVASIIVPLKETNLSKSNSCNTTTKSTTTAVSASTSSCHPSSVPSIMTSSIQISPTKVSTNSEQIFSTATVSPLQLPIQTFIITPCPITGSAQATALNSQNSQIVTRIANIIPAPILPKTLDSIPLQKIPIKSLLKPIPKIVKRRRRRKKNVIPEAKTKEKSTSALDNKSENGNASEKDSMSKESASEMDTTAQPMGSAEKSAENEELLSSKALKTLELPEEVQTRNDNDLRQEMEKLEERQANNLLVQNETEASKNIQVVSEDKQQKLSSTGNEPLALKEMETTSQLEANDDTVKVDTVAVTDSSEKVRDELNKEANTAREEEPSHENIPVLRIIEASSEENLISTDILSTVVVKSSADKVVDESTANSTTDTAMKDNPTIVKPFRAEGKSQQTEQMQVRDVEASVTPCPTENIIPVITLDISEETEKEKEGSLPEPIPLENGVEDVASENSLQTVTENMNVEEAVCEQTTEKQTNVILQNLHEDVPSTSGILENIAATKISKISDTHQDLLKISVAPGNSETSSKTGLSSNSFPVVETATPTSSEEFSQITVQIQPVKNIQSEPKPLAPVEHLSERTSSPEVSILTSLDKENYDITKRARSEAPAPHRGLVMDTRESVSTTDKISECIARSIDLIDANDSELMELGEHWEDTGTSPKSISPTQIFLNIFPLLPRESSTNTEPSHQPTPLQQQQSAISTSQASKNPLSFLPSSNSRSSFFIDAMLPEDHAGSNSNTAAVHEISDPSISSATSYSPFLPLTSPEYTTNKVNQQISSPFSLSNNYYWNPPPVSSSTNVEAMSTEYRSSGSINPYAHHESPHTKASASSSTSIITTTSPLTSMGCTSKASTVNTSSTITSQTAINSKSGTKRLKSTISNTGAGKLASSYDTPATSKNKPTVSSTTTKTITPSTISVTWTLTGPTATQTSTFQQHHSGTVQSISSTSETTVHATVANASLSSQAPHHACSILDSLNPMDAAFFRPLMNALEGHDFRNLEFPGSNTLPPPPPPLPTLIPPAPTKPLYSTQFSTNSQTLQNPVNNMNYHDHSTTSLMHHHGQPVQMFGNIQQLTPENILPTHDTPQIQPQASANVSSHAHQVLVPIKMSTHSQNIVSKSTSGADKTSRTTGRQKSEPAKKSKPGKSSRTQPYVLPGSQSTTDGTAKGKKGSQSSERTVSTPTQKTSASNSYSFHTIQSHIASIPTKSTAILQNRGHDFQMENVPSAHFQTSDARNFQNETRVGGHTEGTPTQRNLESSEPQKNKEEKSQPYQSSAVTKASKSIRNSFTIHSNPPHSSQAQQNSNANIILNNSTASQALAECTPPTSSIQAFVSRTNAQQEPGKHEQSTQSSNVTLPQTFPMHHVASEPFQLFPEFNVGGNARQFATHTPSHHYHQENSTQVSLQQPQDQSSNNFHIHRSHPYYFPDITSSFETFTGMPIHQPHSQTSNHQVHNSSGKHLTLTGSTSSTSSQSQRTDNNVAKTAYATNTSNASQSHSQHVFQVQQQQQQKVSRMHQSSFTHHNSGQSCTHQVSSTPQHSTLPSQQGGNRLHAHQSSCQQNVPQVQNRNHHSHSSTTTTSTTTTPSSSTSKGKQHQQMPSATSFHTTQSASQSHHHPQQSHNLSHHQLQSQNLHHQQHQNVPQSHPQSTNRSSSSKTVNWMTDTGYRPANTTATSTANPKPLRQSNPFSVSKLVGNSSASAPSKPPQGNNNAVGTDTISNARGNQQQSSSQTSNPPNTVRNNKSTRASTTSSSLPNQSTNNQSQNQSNYCAEALIRKNPPAPANWANDFNLTPATNQISSETGYSVVHQQQSNQHHHHHQQPTASEHFPSYTNMSSGSYHYPTGGSQASSSNASQFPNFNHSQSQHQATHHHHHHQAHVQTMSANNYSTSAQGNDQRQHNPQQPHSLHNQNTSNGQVPYPHQQHYQHPSSHPHHHHQHAHGTTSSVTNFNLSTIFPEINDKRSSQHGLGGGHGRSTVGNDTNTGRSSGNMNSTCNYHHLNFDNQTGVSGNIQ